MEWCEWLVTLLPRQKELTILDVGTGTGCIALYLAKHLPLARVYGIDINPLAVELAKENQSDHHQEHNLKYLQVDFLQGTHRLT